MRIFLVFIVVLNLLYAGWEYLNPVASKDIVRPLADNLKTLELLNEDKIEELKVAGQARRQAVEQALEKPSAKDGVDEADPVVLPQSATCYTLGPFKDENIMLQLRDSIAEFVTDLSIRKRQQSIKHRYWVYVPAQPGKKQAKLMAKKLRQKQVNDFYIVLRGSEKNSISLGHFREPTHANRRMKKVADLGFNAQIKVIYREYDIYWLDYRVETNSSEADFSVDEYISEGVSQLIRDCKS